MTPLATMSLAAVLATAAAGLAQTEKQAPPKKYAVVVNAKNTCPIRGEKARSTIKKLFLKQTSKWPSGAAAKPYGRKAGKEIDAFAKHVLGMGNAELARHWLKMKNMNGTTPPKAVSSDRMLLKYVAKYEGAFGIVTAAAAKSAKGVKILYEF